MEVYIKDNCDNISLTDNGGVLVINAPDDIMVFGSVKYRLDSYNDITKEAVIFDKKVWLEPDWKFRAFFTTEQTLFIADNYPEMLVILNTEPRNPKFIVTGGSWVYFDNINIQTGYLLSGLGVEIESKPL